MGPASHNLCTDVEPSCSWAAPSQPHFIPYCCSSNAHPQSLSGHYPCCLLSLTLGALICPGLAQFRCHLCKKAFFDHPISGAPSPATCRLTWLFYVLEVITMGFCLLSAPHCKMNFLRTAPQSNLFSVTSSVTAAGPGTKQVLNKHLGQERTRFHVASKASCRQPP